LGDANREETRSAEIKYSRTPQKHAGFHRPQNTTLDKISEGGKKCSASDPFGPEHYCCGHRVRMPNEMLCVPLLRNCVTPLKKRKGLYCPFGLYWDECS
jgi:hypothetical protein